MIYSVGRTPILANQLIPKSPFKETVVKKSGASNISIKDIIKAIIKGDQMYHTDTLEFSKTFDFSNLKYFKQLWSIARNQIQYQKDEPGIEVIKSPSATWWSGKADCKSLSLFIGSVLRNANVQYIYRFTHYGDPNHGHVYVVAIDEDGEEIILDAVYHEFDRELKYKFKVDYDPNTGKSFGRVAVSGLNVNIKQIGIGVGIAFLAYKIFINGN